MAGDIERRVAAAIAYSRRSAAEISDAMGGSPSASRLNHWKREFPEVHRHTLVGALARACELPTAFFYANFNRLHEIVDPGAEQFTQLAEEAAQLPPGQPGERRGPDRRAGDRRLEGA